MIRHLSPISGIATHGSELVATAGYDNIVILWDAKTKLPIARGFHDHLANMCSFHPSGKYLGTASSDYTARIWEVPSMRLVTVLPDHGDDVECIAFHPEKPLVATACRDRIIRVFDMEGRLLQRLEGHTQDVNSVDWGAGCDELVSSSDDGTVRRWCAITGRELAVVGLDGADADTIAIAKDGTIFAGSWDGTIAVIIDGKARLVTAHAAGIKRIVFDDVRAQLVSVSYDRTLKVWNYENGTLEELRVADLPAVVWPRSCAFLGDNFVVTGTFGSSYATYDIAAGEWDLGGVDPTDGINGVCVHEGAVFTVGDAGIVKRNGDPVAEMGSLCNFLTSAGSVLLTGGQQGKIFDASTGRVVHQHFSPLNCGVRFEREGVSHAAIGAYSGDVIILRETNAGGVELVSVERFHENAIKGIAYANGVLFSVSAGSVGAFHAVSDFQCIRRIERAHDRISNACAALPNGGYVSVGRDLTLRIWRDGEIETYRTPHANSIKCAAVCSDGRYVATGSYTGHVAIYDLKEGAWKTDVRPTASGISALIYSAERAEFLASSYDGNVYVVNP